MADRAKASKALPHAPRERLLGQGSALILGLLSAMRHNPVLAQLVRAAVPDHKRDDAFLAKLVDTVLLPQLQGNRHVARDPARSARRSAGGQRTPAPHPRGAGVLLIGLSHAGPGAFGRRTA